MATRLLSTQRVVNLASDPASGTAGELYYNTVNNVFKYYNGTAWTEIVGGSEGASLTVSETAPSPASQGDLWLNSSTLKLLVYYDSFWVEIGGGGGGGSGLPDQSGNSGKYLTTNGTDASWATVDALPSQSGNSGKFLTTNGTSASWISTSPTITLSGDLTGSVTLTDLSNGTLTANIATNSVELGTDTTGQYVSAISGTANQITVSGTGSEGVAATLSLPSAIIFPGTVTLNSDPTQALQAATKQYVDAVAEGLHIHASVQTATTANITNLSNPPATIDQVTLTNNMRVLVKNQTNTAQNGIYVYNSSTNTLTRAADFDSVTEIQGGDFVFVTGGSLNDNTGWVQTETVSTIGVDAIVFQQFSGAGTYTAGTGLALNGNQFSNTGVLSVNGSTGTISGIAPTDSPTLTGTPTAPTAATGTNTTQIATTAYVQNESFGKIYYQTSAPSSPTVGAVWVDSDEAPATMSTNDFGLRGEPLSQFAATTSAQLAGVVSDETGTGSLVFANSPAFSGTPTSTTAVVNTNTTQIATTAFVIGQASSTNPIMNGTLAIGTSLKYSREDHIHPTDTSRAALSGDTFTGTIITAAATTSIPSIRIPHGTAPSTPTNGDIWTTTAGFFGRINGTTEQFATVSYVVANTGGLDPFLLGGM